MMLISLAPAERWLDGSDYIETLDLRSELTTNGTGVIPYHNLPNQKPAGRLKPKIPKRIVNSMSVYWQTMKRGQNLMIDDTSGLEEVIGGFRENKSGINAYARTMGYEPDRSRSGFDSVDDAKAFVESFAPWDLFGAGDVTVEPEVRPISD